MKVHVTRPALFDSPTWETGWCAEFCAELQFDRAANFAVTEVPEQSDLIVLLESNFHKTLDSISTYLREPILQVHSHKVCCINYEDSPAGFLCGLYTSLEANRFDSSLHKSWPALHLPNEKVYKVPDELIEVRKPRYLFSFLGSLSHPLRRRLVERFSAPSSSYHVRESQSWYNHTRDELDTYVESVLDSHFVLCPRGHASYTHRIPEVMALGRVPVIIADSWVPFSIPECDYFIRVPERSIDALDLLLEKELPRSRELGRRARAIWLKYFSLQGRARTAVTAAKDLLARVPKPMALADYGGRWRSMAFRWNNQMTLWQRIWRRIISQKKS